MLILDGTVTVENSTELREKLLTLLNGNAKTITVEMGGITEVDVAVIQMLYATHLSCEKLQKSLEIRNPPQVLKEKLTRMSLDFPGIAT